MIRVGTGKKYEYISLNSPTYAKQVVDKITRHSQQIAQQPYSGRKVPEYDAEVLRKWGLRGTLCTNVI